MSAKRAYYGFGFNPDKSGHHILVCIPESSDGKVTFYERFKWQKGKTVQKINVYENDKAKAEISKYKWKMIEEKIRTEFNNQLKIKKIPAGRFINGQTPLEILLGKELLVLVWAIEDCDPSDIPAAIRNWLGLAPEERWWLYTMTNASTGSIDDRRGWRKALRYALCDNPTEEHQLSLFDEILKHSGEE